MTRGALGSTRVVVTGLGVMSPFGSGVSAYWGGLSAGACGIRPVSLIDTSGFRCSIAAEVPDPVPGSRRRSRADRLALAAAREALDDAGFDARDRGETAVVVGAVGGGMLEAETWYWARARRADGDPSVLRARERIECRGAPRVPRGAPSVGGIGGPVAAPHVLRSVLPCSHADTLGHALGLGGPRETVVAACSSGAASIALAADLVTDGVVPYALAGGADALTRICYMGFNALKLLDPEPCRPFDRDRRGMSIGEGAAFLVLEDATRARDRGARIYAELRGAAITSDAYHPTSPHPDGEGMVRAMREALARAGTTPDLVDYVNAHGTATPQNDRIEGRAIREVFGEGRVLVSATKSMIGHTMAAAGSLEAVATILALVNSVVPPTVNHETPDPEIGFDCVPKLARDADVGVAISNSFGFGGQNVTLVLGKP